MYLTAYNITYIISNLFTAYIIKLFMDKYLGLNQKHKKSVYLAYGLFSLITTAVYFVFDIPIIMMITNILCFLGITFFYNGSLKKKVIASFYIYIVLFIVEILVTALTFTSFMSPFEKYGYSNILGLFINKILQFFAVLILINVFIKSKDSNEEAMPLKLAIPSLLIPISTIVIEMIVTSIYNVSQNKVAISVVVLFMINFMAFVLYNSLSEMYLEKMKSAITNQEREYYYKQCLIMQKSVEDSQAFRHDLNNHMSIIRDLISKNEINSAGKYICNLIEESQSQTSIYSATGNIPIDRILNYKLNSLPDKDIDIKIDVNVPTELTVEIMDISTILTNLLDNAVSALKNIKRDKKLNIKIVYRKGMLIISIDNTYDGVVLYENGEIVTTKKDKNTHGKGLINIRKTAEKYNGLLKLSHNENVFTSEVLLYLP